MKLQRRTNFNFVAVAACLLLVFVTFLKTNAQVKQDITGRVLRASTYGEVTGTPFLMDEWTKAVVKYVNGKELITVPQLKYDQIDEVLLFKNAKGETLEVAEPVEEFVLEILKPGVKESRRFRSGFKPVGKFNEKSFYEILSDANVKFVKKDLKTIVDEANYGSSTKSRNITAKTFYYIVKDYQPVQVNKNEKSILAAIGDKTPELTKYVKENKLNLKNDEDILKVLEYYFNISKTN